MHLSSSFSNRDNSNKTTQTNTKQETKIIKLYDPPYQKRKKNCFFLLIIPMLFRNNTRFTEKLKVIPVYNASNLIQQLRNPKLGNFFIIKSKQVGREKGKPGEVLGQGMHG